MKVTINDIEFTLDVNEFTELVKIWKGESVTMSDENPSQKVDPLIQVFTLGNRLYILQISPTEADGLLDWYDSVDYCKFLTINNSTDWVLPNEEELKYMYNTKKHNDHAFNGINYWSSTSTTLGTASFLNLTDGQIRSANKHDRLSVRPIRRIYLS